MICEKCGFDYESEKCPVCNAEATTVITPKNEEKSHHGLIGMIFGIVSFFFGGLFLSIPGLILSGIGLKKNKNDGFSVAGLVTSILSTVSHTVALVIGVIISVILPLAYAIFILMYIFLYFTAVTFAV